jgi:hypothetical protein
VPALRPFERSAQNRVKEQSAIEMAGAPVPG